MGPSPKLPEQGHGAKYGLGKPSGSSRTQQQQQQQGGRHTFLESKTNTLQSGGDKQHGRHTHSVADSAHGSMSSSSKSSASYLSLSKSHSALSDAKSVGNLSDGRLHPDDLNSNTTAAVGPGTRFFPASCLDLNAPSGAPGPPGSPSARHSDRSGHSPASRSSSNVRMESSTLDSSSRHKSRQKSVVPGRLNIYTNSTFCNIFTATGQGAEREACTEILRDCVNVCRHVLVVEIW